jgi:valyl-tRNA synthetase
MEELGVRCQLSLFQYAFLFISFCKFVNYKISKMEIPKQFEPAKIEEKWYKFWLDNQFFKSVPDEREPFTILIPPPNVTGVLHMGHMLNNTIQDVLVRKARMEGKNACWVPGTDHASIATENKVVQKLRTEGIKKSDLTREEFLKHAFVWKDKHGGIILEQLKKLGASCDWDRTRFTMDENYYESVIDTFIDLFQKGKIYRGKRMINWDPAAKTALSDEEVIHKEINSKLYFVKYKISGSKDFIIIATTRPETILGDTAICINPKDERYVHLKGKKAIVPIVNREIPIIFDEYVEMEFGTGCLKVTPAHDVNDYELGKKHNLPVIDVLNEDGTMSADAQFYIGEDRFIVRKKIAKELEQLELIAKVEEHVNKVGFSERTDVVIEPRLSLQWFVSMKELAAPALENVMNGNIQFHPPKFKNTYKHWMENIKDWCISRQLWWGHRIPVYYFGSAENDFVVAKSIEEALLKAKEKSKNNNLSKNDLKQDEDVLDTWFSSWLWPISVFDGLYDKREIDYYYPTNDLVTAPEIMFFWVARMIMAGYEYKKELPFKNVYYTGIVRDKQGRKMSKSLGNSPDPLDLIAKHGADGVRVGMLFSSPAGNDLLFDESLCEQGRNFSNKIWNAFRLVNGWKAENKDQPTSSKIAIEWFESKMNKIILEINDSYDKFKLSEMLMILYKFVWDDFCAWYLEMIKPAYGENIDLTTYNKTVSFFESIVSLLHPLMPFITEEIWHLLTERVSIKDSCVVAKWPTAGEINESLLLQFESTAEIITGLRNIRKSNNIPFKDKVNMLIKQNVESDKKFDDLIIKLCNINLLEYNKEKPSNAFSFLSGGNEFFIPYSSNIDTAAEVLKMTEELNYTKGFLNSVEKKLNNQKFVSNAPENVLEIERKKQSDAIVKIKNLEEKIMSLSS